MDEEIYCEMWNILSIDAFFLKLQIHFREAWVNKRNIKFLETLDKLSTFDVETGIAVS